MVRVWVSHSDWESVMSVHGGGWGGGWVSQRQRGSTDRCWDGLWFPLSPTSNLPVMPQQRDGPELFRGRETQLRTASFKGLFDASIMFFKWDAEPRAALCFTRGVTWRWNQQPQQTFLSCFKFCLLLFKFELKKAGGEEVMPLQSCYVALYSPRHSVQFQRHTSRHNPKCKE